MFTNKKGVILAGVLAICVVVIILLWGKTFIGWISGPKEAEQNPLTTEFVAENEGGLALGFSSNVPAGVVPSESEKERPNGVPGQPQKVFAIDVSQSGFSVERIVVVRGDRVQFNLTTSEGKYDLAIAPPIGGYVVAEEGKTASLGFDAQTVGTYEFACRLFCPDGAIIKGQVVVME